MGATPPAWVYADLSRNPTFAEPTRTSEPRGTDFPKKPPSQDPPPSPRTIPVIIRARLVGWW